MLNNSEACLEIAEKKKTKPSFARINTEEYQEKILSEHVYING